MQQANSPKANEEKKAATDLSRLYSEVDFKMRDAYLSESYQYRKCYLERLDFKPHNDQRFKHNMTPKPVVFPLKMWE